MVVLPKWLYYRGGCITEVAVLPFDCSDALLHRRLTTAKESLTLVK